MSFLLQWHPPGRIARGWWYCTVLLLATLSGCQYSQSYTAKDGVLDLRTWQPDRDGSLRLNGEWEFFWEQLPDIAAMPQARAPAFIALPGSWKGKVHMGQTLPGFGYATFRLRLLLAPQAGPVGLRVPEFLSSYRLYANGKRLCGNGRVGTNAATSQPHFAPHIATLPAADTIDLVLQGANFHFYRGGLVMPITIDRPGALHAGESAHTRGNGLLIGVLLIIGFFHLRIFYYRRTERYNLYIFLFSFLWAVHTMWMDMRWLYDLLGPDWWAFNIRAEIFTGMTAQLFVYLFARDFFKGALPDIFYWFFLSISSIPILLTLFAPVSALTFLETISVMGMPFGLISIVLILVVAFWKKLTHATIFLIPLILTCVLLAMDYYWNGVQIGEGLLSVHYVWGTLVVAISLTVSQRAARSFTEVTELSGKLQVANEALSAKNRDLEAEVRERTAQWVESEKKNRELENARKRRDLENLSASNLMIQRTTDNLIAELQRLQKNPEADFSREIRLLVGRLKARSSTNERILKLQQQVAAVNEAFFERLRMEFPQLTKGERELCAFIKLNLSNKDIADLRNTTVSTINVARHRLRKKLGIERRTELEAFIRQI